MLHRLQATKVTGVMAQGVFHCKIKIVERSNKILGSHEKPSEKNHFA